MATTKDVVLPPPTAWQRHQLSTDHLYAAYISAQSATEAEQQNVKSKEARLRHRSLVVSSILTSVAFLESSINEFFTLCDEAPRTIADPTERDCVDVDVLSQIGAMWRVEKFQFARIVEKYQVALHLAKRTEFAIGTQPYQDVKLLIDLRNKLVHYKPELQELTLGGLRSSPDKFEASYKGKFSLNPLLNKIAIGFEPGESLEMIPTFFPDRCLGSGCAKWSYYSAIAFADEFFNRIGTKWHYKYLFDNGLMPTEAKPRA